MKNFQNKQKIVKVSKVIRHFLFAGLVLWTICVPLVALQTVALISRNSAATPAALYLQCGVVVLLAMNFIVNLKLFRFFNRLRQGNLFDAQTVAQLDAAGKWWIGLWFFESIYYQCGHSFLNTSNAWGFSNLFAGLALVFVAWLLKEGQTLQEEQELTV
jgi:hypothetical protein